MIVRLPIRPYIIGHSVICVALRVGLLCLRHGGSVILVRDFAVICRDRMPLKRGHFPTVKPLFDHKRIRLAKIARTEEQICPSALLLKEAVYAVGGALAHRAAYHKMPSLSKYSYPPISSSSSWEYSSLIAGIRPTRRRSRGAMRRTRTAVSDSYLRRICPTFSDRSPSR